MGKVRINRKIQMVNMDDDGFVSSINGYSNRLLFFWNIDHIFIKQEGDPCRIL